MSDERCVVCKALLLVEPYIPFSIEQRTSPDMTLEEVRKDHVLQINNNAAWCPNCGLKYRAIK
jgi:hypothetical protein